MRDADGVTPKERPTPPATTSAGAEIGLLVDRGSLTEPAPAVQATAPSAGKRLVYIDVLRGIAILAVIIHHLPAGLLEQFGKFGLMGGRGVDLFFVLSGFLIGSTALARASRGASRAAQTKAFFLLRTLRIWPLYFGLVGLYLLDLPIFDPNVGFVLRKWPGHYLTFTSNDFGQLTLELGIFWSLAIEEQFYFVWPIVALMVSRRRLIPTILVLVPAVVVLRGFMIFKGAHIPALQHIFHDAPGIAKFVYRATFTRADGLLLGAFVAVTQREVSHSVSKAWRRLRFPIFIATALGIFCGFKEWQLHVLNGQIRQVESQMMMRQYEGFLR